MLPKYGNAPAGQGILRQNHRTKYQGQLHAGCRKNLWGINKRRKIAEKINDWTNYGILGIVAIVAVVGLIVLFIGNRQVNDGITGFAFFSSKQDCVSSTQRPCYDKQTGNKQISLLTKGGENAFEACLNNAAPNDKGELVISTAYCDGEKYGYCYDGKSNVRIRKFEGVCGSSSISITNPNCPDYKSVPYHTIRGAMTSVSGVTADIRLYPSDITAFVKSAIGNGMDTANRIAIRSLFKTKNGVLLAGGDDYLWSEFRSLLTIHRSLDEGRTWTPATVPVDGDSYFKFVNDLAEDANGILYAVGRPGVMKSVDGGMNWKRVNISLTPRHSYAQTNRDFVRNVLVLRDNSVLITVPFYQKSYEYEYVWFYEYTDVYRTTDGGATWSLYFTQNQVDITAIVEAQDGALVFTDQNYVVHRFANGISTPVFSNNFGVGPLLKTKNGMLYLVAQVEDVRGRGLVTTAYASSDNGVTWKKMGELPLGSINYGVPYKDTFMEGSDGRLYLLAWTNCWGGTIYQSTDGGRKWEVLSGNVPGLSFFPQLRSDAFEEVNGKVLHLGMSAGVVFSTP